MDSDDTQDKTYQDPGTLQEELLQKLTKLVEHKVYTEDLILEVKKNPAIWDIRTEAYSDKVEKIRSWNNILIEFIPFFESMPVLEQNILVTIMQRKWKGIRSCYTREILSQEHKRFGLKAPRKRQYRHFKHLSFLEAVSRKKTIAEDCNNEDVSGDEYCDYQSIDVKVEDSHEEEAQVEVKRPRRSRTRDSSVTRLEETSKKKSVRQSELSDKTEDEHKVFLQSSLQGMKKVSSNNRVKLLSRLLSMIASMQDEESIDISGTPASTSQVAEVEDPLVSRTSEQYAQYVASKLSKMDSYQCIYAENLINQVLFKGALDNLRENTTLYTPPDS